jgi:PAS domain S-box-containing protein
VEGVKDYAIFMVDADGYVLSWNKGAEQLYGYTESEIIGKPASVFYPEDSSQNLFRNLTISRKSGRVEEEGWRIRKNGSRFQANVVITALKDKKGNLIGFGKVTRDITEKNKVE